MQNLKKRIGNSPEKIQAFFDSHEYDFQKSEKIDILSNYLDFIEAHIPKDIQVPIDLLKELYHAYPKKDGLYEAVNLHVRSIPQLMKSNKSICSDASRAGYWLLHEMYEPLELVLFGNPYSHAVTAYKDPLTDQYGAIGFSRYPHLKDRYPIYKDIEELAASYDCPEFKAEEYAIDDFLDDDISQGMMPMPVMDWGPALAAYIKESEELSQFSIYA